MRHLRLTGPMADRLAGDLDPDVRRQVAGHPRLPAHLRDRLGADVSARVRVAVFARPDTPDGLRAQIYAAVMRPSQEIEHTIAVLELRNLDLPWVTADPLPHVSSPYTCFRSSAARNRALPADVAARLLRDDESVVRTTMARHAPHLVDADAAERIDREFRPDKRTLWRPADEFPLPPSTLRRLATDPDPRMRQLAPRDPDLPPDLASRLAADPEPSVRQAVATHPRLPTPALVTLLTDDEPWVVSTAAASPTLPVSEMELILNRAGVATRP
ncbi:hypothetical protein Air01nite_19330 [Asanoa iriomotensis]|uniref:Leucine rich repeat (LRR) protein n=2 Tax=Asanoa iriomotensis TaxID=234613 RepID=A0ABQ4BZ93_9ACTN|nr:hypothetical protein Air01nite_19330 [Asanoa iriomotensis]